MLRTLALEERSKGGSIMSLLLQSLFKEDDTGDVLLEVRGGEEELAVGLTIGLHVLDITSTSKKSSHLDLDHIKTLLDSRSALVRSKDTLARSNHSLGNRLDRFRHF